MGGFQRFNGLLMVQSECIFRRSVRACYHQWRDDFYSGHGNVLCCVNPTPGPFYFCGGPMFVSTALVHWILFLSSALLCRAWERLFWIMSLELIYFHHNVCCFAAQFITSFVICVIVFHCKLPRLPA